MPQIKLGRKQILLIAVVALVGIGFGLWQLNRTGPEAVSPSHKVAVADEEKAEAAPALDPAMIAAWEAAGWKARWGVRDPYFSTASRWQNKNVMVRWHYLPPGEVPAPDQRSLPVLSRTFTANEPLAVDALPAPPTPFGLIINCAVGIRDARGITSLKRFDQLKNLVLCGFNGGVNEIADLKGLQVLDLMYNLQFKGGDLDELAGLNHLTELYLLGTQVDDRAVEKIASLPHIRILDLDSMPIDGPGDLCPVFTDAGFAHLGKLKELRSLSIASSRVRDLTPLAGCEHLTHLNVSLCHLRSLEPLVGLHSLKEVTLWHTQIDEAGLEPLARRTAKLKTLDLPSTSIDRVTLKPFLRALEPQKRLNLVNPQISDEDLDFPAEQDQIEELFLSNTTIRGPGLVHLKKQKNLRTLFLDDTPIDGAALRHLREISSLKGLELYGTKIAANDLGHLSGMRLSALGIPNHLKTDEGLKHYLSALDPDQDLRLDLSGWQISKEGMNALASHPRIVSLHLPFRGPREGFEVLAKLDHLNELSISDSYLSEISMKHIGNLKHLKVLQMLSANSIEREGIKHLMGLSQLESLSLTDSERTGSIKGADFKQFIGTFKNLKKFDIPPSARDNDGLECLLKMCKPVPVLRLNGWSIDPEGVKMLLAWKDLEEVDFGDNLRLSAKDCEILKALPRFKQFTPQLPKVREGDEFVRLRMSSLEYQMEAIFATQPGGAAAKLSEPMIERSARMAQELFQLTRSGNVAIQGLEEMEALGFLSRVTMPGPKKEYGDAYWGSGICRLHGWRPNVRLASLRKLSEETIPAIAKRAREGKATENERRNLIAIHDSLGNSLGYLSWLGELPKGEAAPEDYLWTMHKEVAYMEDLLQRVKEHRKKYDASQK